MSKSELDYVVNNYAGSLLLQDSAILELAVLRARAAAADRLQAERDELKAKANVSICAWCGQECEKSATGIAEHVITCEKRPEHAMLAEFEKSIATITAQAVRIAELEQDLRYISSDHCLQDYAELDAERVVTQQAAQLEQVRILISDLVNAIVKDSKENNSISGYTGARLSDARRWLAANAPSPEADSATWESLGAGFVEVDPVQE